MARFSIFILLAGLFSLAACTPQKKQESPSINNDNMEVMADTIQYSVDIKPENEDEPWLTEQVAQLNGNKLVDKLFESVYKHQANAYDFATGAPLTIEAVKDMEIKESYDRENATRLHFWECWKYDAQGAMFEKKVLQVMIAYQWRDEYGDLKGYKAGIVIKMN